MRFLISALIVWAFALPAHADVLVGVAGPMTGQYQAFGRQMLVGARAAADAINAKGGIGGEQLRVISADDACDTKQAESVAQKMIDDRADVVVGHFCSNASLAAARLYSAAGISMISPMSGLPQLTDAQLTNVIRVSTRLDDQGAFAAQRVLQKNPSATVAVLDDSTAQNKAIAASFIRTFQKSPGLAQSFAADTKDFSEIIVALKSANADLIYCACAATDAGRLAAQSKKAGIEFTMLGPDALLAEQFWAAAGAAGKGTVVSFPSDPLQGSRARSVATDLEVAGQDAEGATLPSFAAVELFAAAAQVQGGHSGTAIAKWLRGGTLLQTVIGPFRFDAKGDGADLRFTWYRWENGSYQALPGEN